MEENSQDKLIRAKKRVDQLKGFYIHLAVYIVVNAFLLVNIYIRTANEEGSFWQVGHFLTLFFWGMGLLFHASQTFNFNPFFGKKWEEKQIQKYIEKDKRESEKYK